MKTSRLFILGLGIWFMAACAPNGADSPESSLVDLDEKVEGVDTSLPTEDEEAANMIESRLAFLRSEKLRLQGVINYEKCRSGIRVPDRVPSRVLALTFDDGPNPNTTPRILDILKARGVKATFFVLGSRAKANPALIQRMKDEGHLIASHSHTHKNFGTINQTQTQYEIKTPNTLLAAYMTNTKFFRYPYGNSSCKGNQILESLAYQSAVGWHIDSCDWAMTDGFFNDSEARVCNGKPGPVNFLEHTMKMIDYNNGGIALFHDIHDITVRNMGQIIANLLAQNYKFVRIDNKTYFPRLNHAVSVPANSDVSEPAPKAKATGPQSFSLFNW